MCVLWVQQLQVLTFDHDCDINHRRALGVDGLARVDSGIVSRQLGDVEDWSLGDDSLDTCNNNDGAKGELIECD